MVRYLLMGTVEPQEAHRVQWEYLATPPPKASVPSCFAQYCPELFINVMDAEVEQRSGGCHAHQLY